MLKTQSCLVIVVALVLAASGRSEAAPPEDAKSLVERATAAFALGRYAEAAQDYEKAFYLKPDPALLYNAAQSHRLAGNKERALTLYQNFLRVFSKDKAKAQLVEQRIEELTKAIEEDKRKAKTASPSKTEPPPVTAPPPVAPPPAPPPSPPPTASTAGSGSSARPETGPPPPVEGGPSSSSTTLGVAGEAPPDERPLTKRPVFWVAVGGAVVLVGVGVVLAVALGGSRDPKPSLGVVRVGN